MESTDMKRYIREAADPLEYNSHQTEVGSRLKTLRGSNIQRSPKFGVGKEIGGDIYVHKDYATDVVPAKCWKAALQILQDTYPHFQYNCIRWSPKTQKVAFQEAPDFDTAGEPVVGDYVTVDCGDGTVSTGHSNYIWHHKWEWVRNDYTGFDVAESWNWSKKWLSVLKEPSDGNGLSRWKTQLKRYNLS